MVVCWWGGGREHHSTRAAAFVSPSLCRTPLSINHDEPHARTHTRTHIHPSAYTYLEPPAGVHVQGAGDGVDEHGLVGRVCEEGKHNGGRKGRCMCIDLRITQSNRTWGSVAMSTMALGMKPCCHNREWKGKEDSQSLGKEVARRFE